MTLSAGTRLGSYEILAPLGAGGMGEVYRARDARLGREVALKVLPAELSQDPERLSRFEQEARAASALNHPNIITIYEVGASDGTAFIAMELVDGKTLRELSASDPLPIRRVIGIAVQVAEGLAKAHGVGIVHRDLKPENVMVSRDGYVKILDFGLAKLVEPELGEVSGMPTLARPETHPGTVLGTVGYMSPEQASGLPLDFRSDQFSFGSILYEITSGRKAFTRKTAAETMSAIIREEPEPLARLRPDLAPPVRWIVERCLAKDPEERYASTRDLARDLVGVRDHISEVSSGAEGFVAAPVRKKRALLPVLAGLGLLVLGIAAGRVFRGGRSAGESAAAPRFQRLTFRRGEIHNARFAPDGQTVFYGATWTGDKPRLYFTRFQSPESWAPDLGGAGYDILAVSPSGELAILDLEGILARVPMAGGTPRQVMTGAEYAGADWAPDGKDLAVVHKVAQRMRLEYPVGKVLLESEGPLASPRISPDGNRIAFFEEVGGISTVNVVEASGKGKRALSSGWPFVSGVPTWTPDGKEIWFTAAQQGEKSAINAVNLESKLRLVTRVPGELELDDISRDRRVLVGHHALVWILMGRAQGEEKDRDLSWLDESIPVDLSADGKTLLFNETGQGSGRTSGVYLRKMDGSPPARLGDGYACALSPDGARVIALHPDQRRLLVMPTGPGQTSVLPGEYSSVGWASWLPDGKKIVLAAQLPGGARRLFVQDVAGGGARPLGPENQQLYNFCNTVSPDGKTVIASTAEGKAVLVPIEGGEARPLPGLNPGDRPIRWSEDGRSVYIYRRPDSPSRIWLLDVSTGSRKLFKEVTQAEPTRVVFQLLITPDGKAYVYGFRRGFSDLYVIEGLK